MAVTAHWSGTVTIRGITYTVGTGTFTCYAAAKGTSSSEGAPQNSITLTKGNTYRLRGWAEGDTVTHPYSIGTSAQGSGIGWFKEDIFPYKTYAITFNKNTTDTVSNMPSNGTKNHGVNYTLPSNIPTRTGYKFKGWGARSSSTSPINGPTSMGFSGYYSENAAYTYYAIWEKNYVKAIWNAAAASVGSSYGKNNYNWITNSSGTVIETKGYYGNTITTPTASTYGLTRTGYTLTGWQIKSNQASGSVSGTLCTPGTAYNSNLFFKYSDSTVNVNTATNFQSYVYSVWTANTYTITLNANGGTLGSTKSVWLKYNTQWQNSSGSAITSIAQAPTRTGYTFDGFYTAKSGGTKIINADKTFASGKLTFTSSDTTLYARWIANTVNITYHRNGGTIGNADYEDNGYGHIRRKSDNNVYFHVLNYASTDTDPYNASTFGLTKTGYTFNQWKVRSSGKILNQNEQQTITNYAHYDDANKTAANTSTVYCYLDAQWTANTYTVTYNANGGSGSMSTSTATYNQGFKTRQNAFTRTGYTFNGWREDNATNGTYWGITSSNSGTYESGNAWTWTYTKSITLYAQWKANTNTAYTVKHWTQKVGGDGLAHNSTNYKLENTENKTGTTASSVTPSVKSYNGFKSPSTQTVTIKADGTTVVNYYYDRIVYTITYTLNGGTASSTLRTNYSILSDTFTLPSVSKNGYTFTGWTGSNGTTAQKTVTISKGSYGNKSYTANFNANNYTITFNANGGTLPSGFTSLTTKYDTSDYWSWGTMANTTRPGFSLAGYYDAASGGNKIYNANGTCYAGGTYWSSSNTWKYAGNVTAYAHWTERNLVKIYNGSSWVNAVPFVYDGTNWRETYPYVYNSGWKQCK